MSEVTRAGEDHSGAAQPETWGPVHKPVNPSHDAPGSIHDDQVAQKLGFRGGTVAGDVLMDSFPPLLVDHFGDEWLRSGSLSLYFRQAIEGGDPVRTWLGDAEASTAGSQATVRMYAPDDALVCEGTASVGDPEVPTALHGRDLRATPEADLKILAGLSTGSVAPGTEIVIARGRQGERRQRGYVTLPVDDYTNDVEAACPSTLIGELLYRYPRQHWTPKIGDGVGLFGAIEVRQWKGPVVPETPYHVSAEIVAMGQSPKTEYFWFDSQALDEEGEKVATMRMMLRFMKASSSLYA